MRVFAREGFALLGRSLLPKKAYSLDMARGGQRLVVTAGDDKVRMLQVPSVAEPVDLA